MFTQFVRVDISLVDVILLHTAVEKLF